MEEGAASSESEVDLRERVRMEDPLFLSACMDGCTDPRSNLSFSFF